MSARHKNKRQLPCIWLMTDPRFGDALLAAVQRLPARSGVIFRHYQLEDTARRRLFGKIRRVCARRGHLLVLAGDEAQALLWNADGFHDRTAPKAQSKRLIRTAPIHSPREIAQARRTKVDMLFLSPLFTTASHEGARPLGRHRFIALALLARGTPVIALGGVTKTRARTLNARYVHGWAAIDAFRV